MHNGSTKIAGSLPAEIGRLTKLQTLDLRLISIQSELQSEIHPVSSRSLPIKLTALNLLEQPRLVGPGPRELGSLKALVEHLDLTQVDSAGQSLNTCVG